MTTSICCCRFSSLMVWTRNDPKPIQLVVKAGLEPPHGLIATSTRWPLDHPALLPVGLGTLRSDDGDGGEERQKSNRFSNQNNTFARASRFFVHFFAVTARLRRENAQFHVVQRTYTSDDEISSLYLNLDMVLRNFNFRRIHLHLTKLVTWSNRDEDWKNVNLLFQRRFR